MRLVLSVLLASHLALGVAQAAPAADAASTPLASSAAAAASVASYILPPAPQLPASTPGSLLQTLFALALVLGVLIGTAWLLKRFGPRALPGNSNVKLVGALSLGGRERVLVVEVGEQWIVVGASPGRVNALATMPKQAGAAELSPPSPPSANFADWLKQKIEQRNAS